jgi:glycosyltransferase involved in cell wall biosynthesis
MKKVVCIPAFNEAQIIEKIILDAKKFCDVVIVCDDGSSDQTSLISENAGAIVIRHKKNFGKGKALKSLFEKCKEINADVMVTIDGDGQFITDEIPLVMEPITTGEYDVSIGYRFENADEMPRYRKIGNHLLDKMVQSASNLPFRDTQSGFRGYSKKAINAVSFNSNGFGADSEILISASKQNLKFCERKVTVIYNTGMPTSTNHPIRHTAGVISTVLELITIKRPLTILGIPGLGFIAIGLAFGINAITIFNLSRTIPVAFTVISVGTFLIGLILLMMAFVLFSIATNAKNSISR